MWINCADSARGIVIYVICAEHARRDLTLMLGALEYLPTGEDKTRSMIEVALREAPSLTTENVMRARYLESYDLLSAPIEQQHFWVDKRATVRKFNRLLSPSPSKAFCDAPQQTSIYKALYTYNYAGDLFATAAASYSCVGLDQVNTATQSVVEARRELLTALERPPP
jgi:hypothetical protein